MERKDNKHSSAPQSVTRSTKIAASSNKHTLGKPDTGNMQQKSQIRSTQPVTAHYPNPACEPTSPEESTENFNGTVNVKKGNFCFEI